MEYLVSGTADVYSGASSGPAVVADQDVPYTTRILARYPEDPDDFSGRVVVEPFNTSALRDSDAAWNFIGESIMAQGDAWIGVTVRNLSLDSGDAMVPAFETLTLGPVDVPVLETETDVEGYVVPEFTKPNSASVRRADADEPGDLYRLYDVPGAAHSNASPNCSGGGTTFPQQYLSRAAYRNLLTWAEDGKAPVSIDRGLLLEADREVILTEARERVGLVQGLD